MMSCIMRTTLALDDDVIALAKALARRKRVSVGRAVSELVRRGAHQPIPTQVRAGLTTVRLPEGSPRVTVAAVNALLDEVP